MSCFQTSFLPLILDFNDLNVFIQNVIFSISVLTYLNVFNKICAKVEKAASFRSPICIKSTEQGMTFRQHTNPFRCTHILKALVL